MNSKFRLTAIAAALTAGLTGCGVEIIGTGHRGLETNFGEIVSDALPEGLYTYNPFTSDINEYDIRVQKYTGESITYTKDVQKATIVYVLNIAPDPVYLKDLIKNVGPDYIERLSPQIIVGTLKEVVGKWEAVDLIEHRDKAMDTAYELIRERLAEKHLLVSGFEATDITYTHEFEQSVEQKVVAIQKAIEEKNRTVQKEELAKQKIINAQAEAESMKIRAQALERNPKLTEWEAVQKWDGHLPTYMLGGNSVPFINLK